MDISNFLKWIKTLPARDGGAPSRDELLRRLSLGWLSRDEFLLQIKASPIPIEWLEQNLRAAYAEMDSGKISVLIGCFWQESLRARPDTQELTRLACQIMSDPRCDQHAEEIAEIIGLFELKKPDLQSFVNACKASVHNGYCSWDVRKAFDCMYGMYVRNTVSKAEIAAAFHELMSDPVTDIDDHRMRDTLAGYIELLDRN